MKWTRWARLVDQKTLREVEFQPGSYFYDAAAGRLYVSSTDLRPADQHRYSVLILGRPIGAYVAEFDPLK